MHKILKYGLLLNLFLLTSTNLAAHNEPATVEDAEKILVKLDRPEKLQPEIKLTKVDASVFFVNATPDSPITLEIGFGSKKGHCATGNLKWFPDEEKIKSIEPIAPRNFAGACFPESGRYPITIYGLNKDGSASRTVIVAP